MTYDEAVSQLHQVSFNDFVAERKRLAAELKPTDKDAAARLGKLPRPPVSAWAVNQLWWRERERFEQLMAAAESVKAGDRDAAKEHRLLLSDLREAAAELLKAAGNAATEPTLRRVQTTLAAVAATGGFGPDAPGALSADRDPPGFETFVGATTSPTTSARRESDEAARRRAEAEQKRAEEEERQRRLAERERLSAALREARELQAKQQREASRLRGELEAAEQDLKRTAGLLAEIEAKLAEL
jgi:hypothetical protein